MILSIVDIDYNVSSYPLGKFITEDEAIQLLHFLDYDRIRRGAIYDLDGHALYVIDNY